jgi:hypothetical protein
MLPIRFFAAAEDSEMTLMRSTGSAGRMLELSS